MGGTREEATLLYVDLFLCFDFWKYVHILYSFKKSVKVREHYNGIQTETKEPN